MDYCVLSLNVGEKYEKLFANCVQTHKQYANKWGYGYKLIDKFTIENVNINYIKYDGMLKCFDEGYKWVLFVDSDAMVNNMDIPIKHYTDQCPPEKDIIMMREIPLGQHCGLFGCLNGGVYFIRNTDWTRHFLREMIEIGKNIPDKKITEQDVLNHILYQNPHLTAKFMVHEWDRPHSINGFLSFNALTAHKDDFIIHFISCSVHHPHLVYEYMNLRDETPDLVFHKDEYPKYFERVKNMYPCLMNWPMYGFKEKSP